MKSKNNISCPNCNAITCVLGVLDPSDSDCSFAGHFRPLYIKQKSFWSIINTGVNIDSAQGFYACYSCGHLWGKINREKLVNVLNKLEWHGEIQVSPKKPTPILEWLFSSIIAVLIIFIIYVEYFN